MSRSDDGNDVQRFYQFIYLHIIDLFAHVWTLGEKKKYFADLSLAKTQKRNKKKEIEA